MTIYDDATNATVGLIPVAVGAGLLQSASQMGRRPVTKRVVIIKRVKGKRPTVSLHELKESKGRRPTLKLGRQIPLKTIARRPSKPERLGKVKHYRVRGGTLVTRRSMRKNRRR